MSGLDYFFDGQFRAYIVQMVRAFSGFQYSTGLDADGNHKLRTVPVTYANTDSQVASILRNNSENTLLSVPQMTCYMVAVTPNDSRRQVPNHVDTRVVVEREIDVINNKYTSERGKSYTVERFMPVPYDLTFKLDIWVSNELQKHQLMEQILVLFNPSLDIQTSTNPLDWTALLTISLTDINWSSRSIPIGADTGIEIGSLTFTVPAWINPPAKVMRERLIEQVITNISTLNVSEVEKNRDFDGSAIDWARGDVIKRSIVTPGDHSVSVDGNTISLLGQNTEPLNGLGEPWNWINLFELYGKYRPGQSQLRLKTNEDMDDHDSDVIGFINVDQNDPSKLYWTVDPNTLPMNTLPAIDGVIDPHNVWPGNAVKPIPAPKFGDRYIIINDIINNTTWGGFHAKSNDIIEYGVDGAWFIVFKAEDITSPHTVLNKRTEKQLTWTGSEWVKTLAGHYTPGMWRIAL
jgi:T4-like virus Myoviridae tail sheath stabiliser